MKHEKTLNFDEAGRVVSAGLTKANGETVTVTEPEEIAELIDLRLMRRATWAYDDTGQPVSVRITWSDGETVTLTDPDQIALVGR